MVVVDYSDDDIIVIDNIRQLAHESSTRLRMNLIAIATAGHAQIRVNDELVTFGQNQLLLCVPGTMLTDFMSSPDFEFKAMFLTTRIIESFLREKMNIWNETMYIYRQHVVALQEIDIRFYSRFYDLLRMYFEVSDADYPYRADSIQSLLRSAMLGLCGSLLMMRDQDAGTGTRERPSAIGGSAELFRRFLDLLNTQDENLHTVEQYAQRLCVSPKYLSIICKRQSGKNASLWIREHTMEQIRYYLRQTDLTMKQISARLGFASPSFFSKYVKQHFHTTPTRLREK